jgi:hypothetical protein
MSSEAHADLARRPARHRDGAVSMGALFFGLVAGMTAWSSQLLANYALNSHFCYPGSHLIDLSAQNLGWLWPLILAINLAAFVIAVAAGYVSYLNWTTAREQASADVLTENKRSRTEFLSLWGMVFSTVFAIAILFNLYGVLVMHLCR